MSDVASPSSGCRLGHAVYFELKDPSDDNRQAFAEGCRNLLDGQPGVVHFSVGVRAPRFARPVNDQTFDVALFLEFASEADHDRYQTSPPHQQFLAEYLPLCASVRVFDAWTS